MTKVTFFNLPSNIYDLFEQFIVKGDIDAYNEISKEYHPQMVELFLKEQGEHYMDCIPDEAVFSATKSFFNIEQVGDKANELYQSILDYNQDSLNALFEEARQHYMEYDKDNYEDPQSLLQPVEVFG